MDWNKIKAEYIAGGTSYRKLAAKYGVPFSNLKNKAVKEQWAQLREQAENRTTTDLVENIGKKNAKIDEKYFKLVDKLLDKAEEVIENTPVWQVTSLKEMANAMKYLKECKGVRSEADIREQEARIAKLQREAEKEDNTETEIKVTFGAEDKECKKWAE